MLYVYELFVLGNGGNSGYRPGGNTPSTGYGAPVAPVLGTVSSSVGGSVSSGYGGAVSSSSGKGRWEKMDMFKIDFCFRKINSCT